MDFKILSRRAVSLCLCFLLVSLSAVPPAQATGTEGVGSLTIAAGALSTGGLTGSALVSAVAPYVVPVVAIALAGFGINAYVTEQSKQAGMTRSDYVKDTIDHFCSVSSYGAAKFYSTVAKGITVGPTGKIQLSHDASKAISQMIEWMFTQDNLVQDIPSIGNSDVGTIGSYPAFVLNLNEKINIFQSAGNTLYGACVTSSSSPVYGVVYLSSSTYYLCAVSTASFTIQRLVNNSTSGTYYTTNYNGVYTTYNNFPLESSLGGTLLVSAAPVGTTSSDIVNVFRSSGFASDSVSVPGQDCFTGDATDYAENKDVLNPTIDNVVTTLNPDVLNKILDSLGSVATDYTMSIADYLDALTKAYDQALEDVKTGLATLTDAVTGIKEQIAIPDTAAADPSIAAEDTGTFDPAVDDSEPNVPDISEQFQYPLKTLFPFCIPFDLFALYSVFDAEPVAPRVEINYTFPVGNGIPIHVVLDLSPWNSVAATLRAMVLVAFVAGLAVRTRRIFIQA